jgi:peptidoglycan/LPS O-acetylase OafA/YrhL
VTSVDHASRHSAWLPELQGLRGLAALTVVFAHWSALPLVPSFSGVLAALTFVSAANLGVVFFFALSAFLLTFVAVREHDNTGGFSIIAFYVRRCLRIWPLYFTVLALDLVSAASNVPGWGTPDWPWIRDHAWLWITFLSNWSIAAIGLNGFADPSTSPFRVLWSIAVEEQFYLIYPIALSVIWLSSGRLKFVVIATCTIALLARTVSLTIPVEPAGGMYYATTSYLDVFVAGGIAGAIAARGGRMRAGTWCLRIVRQRGVGWLLAVSLVLIGVRWQKELTYPYTPLAVALYGLTGVVFALTILWLVTNMRSVASRTLRVPPLQWLGALSFGMYLLHPLAIPIAETQVAQLPTATQSQTDVRLLIQLSIYLVLVVTSAAVAHFVVELPFLHMKQRLVRATAPTSQIAESPTV